MSTQIHSIPCVLTERVFLDWIRRQQKKMSHSLMQSTSNLTRLSLFLPLVVCTYVFGRPILYPAQPTISAKIGSFYIRSLFSTPNFNSSLGVNLISARSHCLFLILLETYAKYFSGEFTLRN